MLPQCLDALTSINSRVCIIKDARPRRRILDNEHEAGLLVGVCTAILQLRDGEAFRVVVLFWRDVAIAKGKEPDINVCLLHIFETFLDRPLICRDVILHRSNLMPRLTQRLVDHTTMVFQVFICRGEINRRHCQIRITRV